MRDAYFVNDYTKSAKIFLMTALCLLASHVRKDDKYMTTTSDTYDRLINKPFVISIIFGFIGLLDSMYSLRIPFGDFHLNLIWSIAFPLMITLTYGLTFGLLSVTIGLTFLYSFLLGFMNGYGSFVAMIALYAWILFHGYGKKRRELKPTPLNHPFVIQLSYSVLRILLYALLFQPLVQLNPPPLTIY